MCATHRFIEILNLSAPAWWLPKNIRFLCFERSIMDQNLLTITDLVSVLDACG
jgi:hypothetical protein